MVTNLQYVDCFCDYIASVFFTGESSSDEVLLHELDAAVEGNYLQLASATESFYKDVGQIVRSLHCAIEQKKEANNDVIIEFIAHLKDQQSTANAAEIQKKRAEMQQHYVNSLMKVIAINFLHQY